MSRPPRPVPLDTYWGVIQAAARARQTTAAIWLSVRYASDLANETLAPGAFQRMNQLRGLASSQLRADAALAGLGPDRAITADQISLDINSRDQLSRNLNRRYKVGFDVEGTRISTGDRVVIRLTDTFSDNLPATAGDLENALGLEAPALAQDSDLILESVVGNVGIREV